MFALLKRHVFSRRGADPAPLFEAALLASRNPVLYRHMGVPDTFDGRFDALLLHLWPVFRALQADDRAGQALYDFTFKRMELALRETGTGDLGVARHVRAMMKAFYGRMVTYNACEGDAAWTAALARNLYGTLPDAQVPAAMVAYARSLRDVPVALDVAPARITYPAL